MEIVKRKRHPKPETSEGRAWGFFVCFLYQAQHSEKGSLMVPGSLAVEGTQHLARGSILHRQAAPDGPEFPPARPPLTESLYSKPRSW